MNWRESFIVAGKIELLEAKLASGELDQQQSVTVDAILMDQPRTASRGQHRASGAARSG
jgi:hypothetical protein